MTEPSVIRPYRPEDRNALYDLCVPAAQRDPDRRPVWADPAIFTAAPYLDLEPELAFVVDDGHGTAVGYLLATADTQEFVTAYRTRWLPRVAARFPEPPGAPATPDEAVLKRLHHPELMLIPEASDYPAHLHVKLAPQWQGRGYGSALVHTLLRALRERGAPAVHLTVATSNTQARAFFTRLGFTDLTPPEAGPVTRMGRATAAAPGD
ncbi:GNAT family N-acetyltransferase [Streptomyces sp. 7-21]|uniref:GNAT family N-acetyltransferase n=1 Tax=Streptomyces sp. 7-21 TaxID=2802283 RepID=UPI00191F4F1C|nr:GNAT family N-acetyltransferase [Streptomyces sp. 7-21]MBL1066622.1 GNAT family N-acetyltransferase [Streptomyces sp. 7-21]